MRTLCFMVTLTRSVDDQQFIIKKKTIFNHHKHNKERAPPNSVLQLVKRNACSVSNICYTCFLRILLLVFDLIYYVYDNLFHS